MSEKTTLNLSQVAETLLIPLYIRAGESQRPDALIKDEKAVALIQKLEYDFSRITQIKIGEDDKVGLVLRNREFDRYASDFMQRRSPAVVVHIGCGLDSRFERVDDGQVEWYDLDLPEVIELRRELLGGEGGRYHLLACSVFDEAWLSAVSAHPPRPFLFLAEGVMMYFNPDQVKTLVLRLKEHFPGAELVFDAFAPYLVRMNNLRLSFSKIGARYHWGLKRGKDLEKLGDGIHLLDEWFYFSRYEPRLAAQQWMRHIPFLAKASGIYHYRLGELVKE
jgi:O-methyltransferase involved in polyketide biosynthesis